jgi:uncharacterized phage infection (PIP) family protein YhgE
MNLKNLFKGREVRELEEEIVLLKDKVHELKLELVDAKDENRQDYVSSRQELDRLESGKKVEINRLENKIFELEQKFKTDLEKAVAQERKSLKFLADKQDREHADRMKKLENEHAAKIAKCDRDLESDKISFRKYLKQEYNTRIETLEKLNTKLQEEVSTLRIENSILTGANESLGSINDSLTDSVNELSKGVTSLSNKIADGLVKSIPTITGDFSTPESPESHLHVEVPGNKNGGNNEKKN